MKGFRGHGEGYGYGHFCRQFFTKEEEIAKLEAYLEDLKAETKAVESKIQMMKEWSQKK
ncbi:MAG TPA: hypothetical protein VN374_03170 [Desulfitobacteriaceae bacterium]|nr:hypothetical protein [Desulfitobacteriaceae bacterium]